MTQWIDTAAFRSVSARFATGVAVATSHADGLPIGMTVNAFTTVSLHPALLLVCLNSDSRLIATIRRSGVFAVTVLAACQRDCAQWFANGSRPTGPECFADVPTRADAATGCPLLTEGVAYFGCVADRHYPRGDHVVLLGEVKSFGMLRCGPPLLFLDGRYSAASAETVAG
jgi:3-hydroxy-9,10-secoandrosta-1,3,5(10)-triene-9,17-dione monooxygenase reductase component